MLSHAEASFLQSYAWGRLKQQFDWAPVRLRIETTGTARTPLAQVLFRRLPYVPYTLGYIPRGPILNYACDRDLDLMDCALGRMARRYRAIAITWEPPVAEDDELTARLIRYGLRPARGVQARATRLIDLTPSMDEITAQQHHKWRYNTRLARRHGVRVREAHAPEDLSRWYALLRTTAERDAFGIHSESYYRRFWLATAGTGATALLLAEHDGQLLGGIMVHAFGATATYLYGASSNGARQLMPNHLLQWEAIRWAKDRGATRYDLSGIADTDSPDHPLAGVTRFKAGFGGQVVRYAGAFDRVYHPALYALARRIRGQE